MTAPIPIRAVHARRGVYLPLCGQTGRAVVTTNDPLAVTCRRCLHLATEAAEEQAGEPVSVVGSSVPLWTPDEAVRAEQNFTRHEVLAYLVEGDLDAAIFRMQRGFERQVRLAGLEREIRESREKEQGNG